MEKLYSVNCWPIPDEGIADYDGTPHYFIGEWDENTDNPSDYYRLKPLTDEELTMILRLWERRLSEPREQLAKDLEFLDLADKIQKLCVVDESCLRLRAQFQVDGNSHLIYGSDDTEAYVTWLS